MEMLHQQVDLSQAGNPDLIWDLDSLARRELAERFIRLFENRLCVWSESVEQLYTNYSLHFPAELGRKMVVLPNPYAFHDTLHGIAAQAIRKTGLCVLPGQLLGKSGLLLSNQLPGNRLAPRSMPFKPALAQIINSQRKVGDEFLPCWSRATCASSTSNCPICTCIACNWPSCRCSPTSSVKTFVSRLPASCCCCTARPTACACRPPTPADLLYNRRPRRPALLDAHL